MRAYTVGTSMLAGLRSLVWWLPDLALLPPSADDGQSHAICRPGWDRGQQGR